MNFQPMVGSVLFGTCKFLTRGGPSSFQDLLLTHGGVRPLLGLVKFLTHGGVRPLLGLEKFLTHGGVRPLFRTCK